MKLLYYHFEKFKQKLIRKEVTRLIIIIIIIVQVAHP
jgi:hypothetical protein